MSETMEFYESIEDYHKFVNSINFDSVQLAYIINSFREKAKNLTEKEKQNIEIEINCLQFIVRNGKIKPLYTSEKNDGSIVIYPNIDLIDEEQVNYLKTRCESLSNTYFRTRFLHIIWYKTKDFEYAKRTIDSYFDLVNEFIKLDKAKPKEHFGIEICYALWNMQDLVFSFNYKITELQELLLNIINNHNTESSCFLRLQLDCIKILVEKVKKNKLDICVLNGIEDVCENTLNGDLSELFASDYFKIGEEISRILKTGSNKWILKQAEYYEKLADSKNPIIAPEYCQKAIDLYKRINNETKINELRSKYLFLSKSVKLTQYCSDSFDLTPCIEEYEKLAEELKAEDILKFLTYSSDIIPKYDEDKAFAESLNEKCVLSSICHTNVIDEYGHIIEKLETEEDELQHKIYTQYDIWYDMQSKILTHFLKKAFELGKFNLDVVLDFLKKSWFGANIEKNLTGKQTYSYNWLQYIEPSIMSFFIKFQKCIDTNEYSILFIPEIDSLCMKFEGIIRDMIHLTNTKEIPTFYFDKDKNFGWNNINKCLRDPNIFKIIPENDVYFLRYFLIDHRNLRNRVAHSLTFLGEYDIYNMIILLIAMLRLSKCLIATRENISE